MKFKIDWSRLGSAVGYSIASGAVTALLPQPYKQYAPVVSMVVGIIHPSPFEVSPVEQAVVESLTSGGATPGKINLASALEAAAPPVEQIHTPPVS